MFWIEESPPTLEIDASINVIQGSRGSTCNRPPSTSPVSYSVSGELTTDGRLELDIGRQTMSPTNQSGGEYYSNRPE